MQTPVKVKGCRYLIVQFTFKGLVSLTRRTGGEQVVKAIPIIPEFMGQICDCVVDNWVIDREFERSDLKMDGSIQISGGMYYNRYLLQDGSAMLDSVSRLQVVGEYQQ